MARIILNNSLLVNLLLCLFYPITSAYAAPKPILLELIIYQQPSGRNHGNIQANKFLHFMRNANPSEPINLDKLDAVDQQFSKVSASISKRLTQKSIPHIVKSWLIHLDKQQRVRLPLSVELPHPRRNDLPDDASELIIKGYLTVANNLYVDLDSQLSFEFMHGNNIVEFDHAGHQRHLKLNRPQYLDHERVGLIVRASSADAPPTNQPKHVYLNVQQPSGLKLEQSESEVPEPMSSVSKRQQSESRVEAPMISVSKTQQSESEVVEPMSSVPESQQPQSRVEAPMIGVSKTQQSESEVAEPMSSVPVATDQQLANAQ